jgi:hypothetical protein
VPTNCGTREDLATFWDRHRQAFAHFGGVPATIVYDRTKTLVCRHVGRGQQTPLHPEALAFAGHSQRQTGWAGRSASLASWERKLMNQILAVSQ